MILCVFFPLILFSDSFPVDWIEWTKKETEETGETESDCPVSSKRDARQETDTVCTPSINLQTRDNFSLSLDSLNINLDSRASLDGLHKDTCNAWIRQNNSILCEDQTERKCWAETSFFFWQKLFLKVLSFFFFKENAQVIIDDEHKKQKRGIKEWEQRQEKRRMFIQCSWKSQWVSSSNASLFSLYSLTNISVKFLVCRSFFSFDAHLSFKFECVFREDSSFFFFPPFHSFLEYLYSVFYSTYTKCTQSRSMITSITETGKVCGRRKRRKRRWRWKRRVKKRVKGKRFPNTDKISFCWTNRRKQSDVSLLQRLFKWI